MTGDQVKMMLKDRFPAPEDAPIVDEYVDEAEHQDGTSVWTDLYANEDAIAEDYVLYKENRE